MGGLRKVDESHIIHFGRCEFFAIVIGTGILQFALLLSRLYSFGVFSFQYAFRKTCGSGKSKNILKGCWGRLGQKRSVMGIQNRVYTLN